MSTTRLHFLYPSLFRAPPIRPSSTIPFKLGSKAHLRAPPCQCRAFTTTRRRKDQFVQRHGKAVEPFLAEGESADGVRVYVPVPEAKDKEGGKEGVEEEEEEEHEEGVVEPASSALLSEETQAAASLPGDSILPPQESTSKPDEATPLQTAALNTADPLAPLETVLQMPPPESMQASNESKPPHLQTPPYVHHFDTYTLVQQVEAGGFTTEQSVTAMKAVRGLLALNLGVAREGLVGKSDVENEIYLFRAACSELKTEIENSRKKSEETMRRERTLLQHEVDILNQKLTQELGGLKDDLKGMFDDRKMSVRMEQRTMESKIQELNYKITVLLNSDSKSEIEGLRWVLTRRSVMGILFMAFMVLTSLRYASYKSHEIEVARKKEVEREKLVGGEGRREGQDKGEGVAEILAAN